MKEVIEVQRHSGSPSLVVVGNILDSMDEYLPDRRIIVVTDSNIHRRYTQLVERFEHIIIGMGETNKTLLTIDKVLHGLLELNADRECFIVGFGGGIVTDVTGFAASVYMRGLRFGFIASTLLAQVDASVGGKNGVNMEGFKNMVGTFNQPDFVLCDTGLLQTLPEREFISGMAEVIKAGVIADPALFGMVEDNTPEQIRADERLMAKIITAAIKVKATLVGQDERETGQRKKLNLGHTFGHAIENSSTSYVHGEAVAIGLCMAADLAVAVGELDPGDAARIRRTVESAGLPTECEIDMKRLLKALRQDKKRDNDTINIVLPTGIGSCRVVNIALDKLDEIMLSKAVPALR